jgi:hypothetical protein
MKGLHILPAVLQDIAEAAAWYDRDGHTGLGDHFIASFYSYLPQIQKDGIIHRKIYSKFHKIIIRPFPYSVYYRHHEDSWIITLVIHAARRPGLIKHLLQKRA